MKQKRVVAVNVTSSKGVRIGDKGVEILLASQIKKRDKLVTFYPLSLTQTLELLYDEKTKTQEEAAIHALKHAPFYDPNTTYLTSFSKERQEGEYLSSSLYVTPLEHFTTFFAPLQQKLPFLDVVFPVEELLAMVNASYLLVILEEESYLYDRSERHATPLSFSLTSLITSLTQVHQGVDRALIQEFLTLDNIPPLFSPVEKTLTLSYETIIDELTSVMIPPSATITLLSSLPLHHFVNVVKDLSPWRMVIYHSPLHHDTEPINPFLLLALENIHATPLEHISSNLSPSPRPKPLHQRPSGMFTISLLLTLFGFIAGCVYEGGKVALLTWEKQHIQKNVTSSQEELSALTLSHATQKEGHATLMVDTQGIQTSLDHTYQTLHTLASLPSFPFNETLRPIVTLILDEKSTATKISYDKDHITLWIKASSPSSLAKLYKKLSLRYTMSTLLSITKEEKKGEYATTFTFKVTP